MKFGGTSVGDGERMRRAAEIVRERAEAETVVVVSAMGGVTDMLIRAAQEASLGDREHWKSVRQELAKRHREVADQLLPAGEQATVLPRLAEQVETFEHLCSGFSLVREVTPRAMDTLASLGELMSAALMAGILRAQGSPAEAVDATELIVTDDNFGNATPLFAETNAKTRQRHAALRRKTIQPVMKQKIPVWIKNTFNPSCPGTKIGPSTTTGQPGVKAITSVSKAGLITVSGKDTMSFARLAAKVFGSLSLDDIPTLMVTQSSADNVLCFAVHDADLPTVKAKLEKAFELEMLHDYVAALEVMSHVAIVVAIGENMKGTAGLAGRAFGALGRRGINIIAIAQGSSELSISFAVKSSETKEAVRAIHEEVKL